jgi:hypothetical protein
MVDTVIVDNEQAPTSSYLLVGDHRRRATVTAAFSLLLLALGSGIGHLALVCEEFYLMAIRHADWSPPRRGR